MESALVFTDFQWGTFLLDEKSPCRTHGWRLSASPTCRFCRQVVVFEHYGSIYLSDEPNSEWRGPLLVDRVDY
jgi:hypothetical protein